MSKAKPKKPRRPPGEARKLRNAQAEFAAWNMLCLKLFEAIGGLTGVVNHCTRNDLSVGPTFMALRDQVHEEHVKAREKRNELGVTVRELRGSP